MTSDGPSSVDDLVPLVDDGASRPLLPSAYEPASVTASRQLAEEARAGRRPVRDRPSERHPGEGRHRQPLPGTARRPAIRPLGRPPPDHLAAPAPTDVSATSAWRLGQTRPAGAGPDGPPREAPGPLRGQGS